MFYNLIPTHTVPSRPQFIRDLQCNRFWDPSEYKFFFNFSWSVPFYMAVEEPIEGYFISFELIREGFNTPIQSIKKDFNYVPLVSYIIV